MKIKSCAELESLITKMLPPEIEVTKDSGNNPVINFPGMRIKIRQDKTYPFRGDVAFEDMSSGLCSCVFVDDLNSYLQSILPLYTTL